LLLTAPISVTIGVCSILSYIVLGIYGLIAAGKQTYQHAKGFSIAWWVFAVISILAIVVELIRYAVDGFDISHPGAMYIIAMLVLHVILMVYFGLVARWYAQQLNTSGDVERSADVTQ
jgi:cytochrome bd-type quinol oxidase subunit 2